MHLRPRLTVLAALSAAAMLFSLVAGTGPALAGPIGFLKPPAADATPDAQPIAGKPVKFMTTVRFAPPKDEDEEPWVGVVWNFGDQTPPVQGGRHYGAGPQLDEVTHTFAQGGEFTVTVTAYHGFKDIFGGFKFKSTKTFKVEVLPKLPLVIGVLTVNGDTLTRLGEPADKRYKVSGNVTINSLISVENDVTADFVKNEVLFGGELNVPAAGSYSNILKTAKELTLDAATGAPKSSELSGLEAKFEIAKFKIEFTKFKIDGPGLEFDFTFSAPRLAEGDSKGKELAKLEFKRFRIDGVAPYLHTLGDTTLTLSNLKIAGTEYGLDTLSLTFNFGPPSKYGGTVAVSFPSDRSISGEIELLDGQLNKLSVTAGVKIPIYTLTGVGDAIYLRSINGQVRNLAVVAGQPPQEPVLAAGEFEEGGLDVKTPGITLEWGAGVPLVEGLTVTPITVDGAAEFDAQFNLSLGGELTLFKDKFASRFKVAQVKGTYKSSASVISLRGKLSFDGLFVLDGTVASSFDEFNYFHSAVATGTVNLPPTHWARKFVGSGSGTAIAILRASPTEKYVAGFRGKATLPVLGEKSVSFQYDLLTGDLSTELDSEIVALLPSKAESRSAQLTGGQGAEGLIVRVLGTNGAPQVNLRMPGGALLTPAAADGTTNAYATDPIEHESTWLLANAPDGTYTAEFDDTGIGAFDVRFLLPGAPPGVTVSAPSADASLARYDALPVTFAASGVDAATPVRVYLDDDGDLGGGYLVASGASLAATTLEGDVRHVPPGTYRVVVETDPSGALPVSGTGTAIVTVREYQSLDLALTSGSLVDAAASGADSFKASGTIAFNADSPDDSFDPSTDALDLSLGDADGPLVVHVGAGDAGWTTKGAKHTWKGGVGATGKVVVTLDTAKHKFTVKLSKADFPEVQTNPVGVAIVFGDDEGVVRTTWTQKKPGVLSYKP